MFALLDCVKLEGKGERDLSSPSHRGRYWTDLKVSDDVRVTAPVGKGDCGLAGLDQDYMQTCPGSFLHAGHGHRSRRNRAALLWSSSLGEVLTPKGNSLGAGAPVTSCFIFLLSFTTI